MKLLPSISLITILAAIPLGGLSVWAAVRSESIVGNTEGRIRHEQLGTYHAERVATAILDCRRYEQGLLLAGADVDSREIHLAGFLWFCDVVQQRLAAYEESMREPTCLEDIGPIIADYRAAVLRIAGRLYLASDAESVREADADLEPFKAMMRKASKCATAAAQSHADTVEAEVVELVAGVRRDQLFLSIGGIASFALLAFGIATLIVPTARRARRLAEIARRLSDGDRNVDCRLDGNDELTQAGEALERMRLLVAERERSLLRGEEESRKLAAVIERTALPTLIADAQGAVRWTNRAAADLPLRGSVGASLERLLRTVGYSERTVADVLDALAQGQVFSGERRAAAPNGTRAWFRLEGYPVSGEPGGVGQHVILERDVSDARRIEEVREIYADMMGKLMGSSPLKEVLDGFVAELEGTFVGLRVSLVVVEGDRLSVAAAPSLPPALCRMMEGLVVGPDAGSCGRCAYTGEAVIAVDTMTHPAWARYRGVAEAFSISACWSLPVRSQSGELLGTLAAYASQPREPTVEELAMLRAGAGFAGLALGRRRSDARAHAVGLELSEAHAEIERLRHDQEAMQRAHGRELEATLGEARDAIAGLFGHGRADAAAEDLLSLLDDAMALDRAGGEMYREWESPASIVRAAIANAQSGTALAPSSAARLIVDPGMPDLVLFDVVRTRRLLAHLLVLLQSPAGGSNGLHDAVSASADVTVRIALLDMATAELPSPKLRFELAAIRQRDERRDLVLAFARRAARHVGGTVDVVEEEMRTLIRVEIPCDAPRMAPRTVSAADEAMDLRGRILIVDDHAEIRALFAHYLRRAGAEVEECESGVAALERMMRRGGERAYDLVLLDMQLPGHDGYSVTRIARAAGCDIPIVAITAHAVGDERARCLAIGCDDFATKPLSRAELLAVVRRQLFGRAAAPNAAATLAESGDALS